MIKWYKKYTKPILFKAIIKDKQNIFRKHIFFVTLKTIPDTFIKVMYLYGNK